MRKKKDYARELDRILDEVQGDANHDARINRFKKAWDDAIAAGVNVTNEVKEAFRAYDDFTKGKHKKIQSGTKTQPARFVRVLFNGQLVQKEVDIDGPTRASLELPEAA